MAESFQTLQKVWILRSSGARDPRQPMVPSRQGPDLAWGPFPGPCLSPGNLQSQPTDQDRTVKLSTSHSCVRTAAEFFSSQPHAAMPVGQQGNAQQVPFSVKR